MKEVKSENLRTIAIVGHGDSGKTSLCSALLFNTKMVNRLGKIDQGNTVTDFDEVEIEKKISIQASVAYAVKGNFRVNLLDTPGFANFVWEARLCLRAAETGLMMINAVEGVEVQSEKIFETTEELGKPLIFCINKMSKDLADYEKAHESMVESFGKNCVLLQLPIGKGDDFKGIVDLLEQKAYEYQNDESGKFKVIDIPADMLDEVNSRREELVEKIAESSESLMEKYLEAGELSLEELKSGLKTSLLSRDIFPVLVTDAFLNIGVDQLLDFLIGYAPSILEVGKYDASPEQVDPASEDLNVLVFKTLSDPFAGKISILKVVSGSLKPDTSYYNTNKSCEERLGNLFSLQGKIQSPEEGSINAGGVVAVSKLKETQTGDTIGKKGSKTVFPEFKFPVPSISFAIEPKSRADEGKISNALQRISEEDPTVKYERDPETKELVISGNGEMHVKLIVSVLKRKYGVEVDMKPPKIPYLETITAKVDIEKKYKKQSGGRGQYGHILIKMEPLKDGTEFLFEDTIFGGSIPKNYVPAVEKGIQEARQKGVVAGYKVINFKVNLYDGSYHDVDSSDMAFKIAASMAFKMAMKKAKPILLEPVMAVEVVIPAEFMGDINGNLSGRRGRIQGMEVKGKNQVIKAFVPMSEMLDFNPALTSITGGRGMYFMEFDHYAPVPNNIQQKVVAQAIKEGRVKEDEEE